ncbi:MAG: penicillin-binding transpeptidase domain-containing protein, partial [Myxococcota bacterium]
YFFDYLANEVTTRYPQSELSRLGLSLYTSLDVGVQAEAERALERGLKALEKKRPKLKRPAGQPRLQGAIVVLHPTTGHILAMVGGRNYSESQFNRITQAKRQPGSAFKPFVYLAALESVPLNERLNNERRTYRINNKRWRPKNYTKEYGGTVSMREALMKSLNLPTIDLADKIGLDSVIETARDFGITTPLQPELSLALGAFEVVPLELALAYAAFAGDGVLPHALALRSVLDDEGKEVKRQHLKIRTVTTPARAFMMTSLLKDVVEHGTASSLKWRGIKYPVAGKTGTTNDYRDAWFVGYTPDIVTLVWVGYDDGKSIGLSASSAAVPIWADLMRRIRWRTSGQWFEAPPDVVTVEICRESGHIATDDCPHVTQEVFNAGEAPTQTCTVHMSSFGRFLDSIGL